MVTLFVLDCSVTMSWCFKDETNKDAHKILLALKNKKAIVPCIWTLEVLNSLKVAQNKNRITQAKINHFITLLQSLPIETDNNYKYLKNNLILDLINRHNLTAYDAAYLELAIRYAIPLVSFDKELCDAARKEKITSTI